MPKRGPYPPLPAPAPLADATTPNLGLVQPEVGASADTWGYKLNANFAILDNLLPLAGGDISGGLNVAGQLAVGGVIDAFSGLNVGGSPLAASAGMVLSGGGFVCSSPAQFSGAVEVDGAVNMFGGLSVNAGGAIIWGGLTIGDTGLQVDAAMNVNGAVNMFGGLSVDAGVFNAWANANVGPQGIYYMAAASAGAGGFIGFGWNGSQLLAFVNGGSIGPVAMQAELDELRAEIRALTIRLRELERMPA